MSFKRKKKSNFNNERSDDSIFNQKDKFSVLIGNYPPLISADGVIQAIINIIRRSTGNELKCKHGIISLDTLEFSISFPNAEQMKAVLDLNGTFIYNNPIWIIKFPTFYGQYGPVLSTIINRSICNGQIDLSNLKNRFAKLGNDPSVVDFNKLDFVEFFLYQLGTESRDKRFFIDSLILNNNNIQDINKWSPYLTFLPTLQTLVLNQNPLKRAPDLPAFPYIIIKSDIKFSQNKNRRQQSNFNNFDDFNDD